MAEYQMNQDYIDEQVALWRFLVNKVDTMVITPNLLVQSEAEAAAISDADLLKYGTSSNIADGDWAAVAGELEPFPVDIYLVDSVAKKRFAWFNGPIKLAIASTTAGDGTSAIDPDSTTPSMVNGHYRVYITSKDTWADDDHTTLTISDPDAGVAYIFTDQTVKIIASGLS